ncbi:hypothetical protein I7I48_09277 [Histoplasma ohiense]|nr:hypothetical protein I7I48_09277 [Histoplasma ohiense (nom. inval.)]
MQQIYGVELMPTGRKASGLLPAMASGRYHSRVFCEKYREYCFFVHIHIFTVIFASRTLLHPQPFKS